MVQQLSLYSVIDEGSFDLLIATISALSGRSPVLFANYNHVAHPNPNYAIEKVNAKNQLVEQTRVQLMQEIPFEKLQTEEYSYKLCTKMTGDGPPIETEYLNSLMRSCGDGTRPWSLSLWDIPSAGKDRKVCTQAVVESVVTSTGGAHSSILSFLAELGYVPGYQFVQLGTQFYLENGIVFQISKLWALHGESGKTSAVTKDGFLIKAYLNVPKATDLESINQGTAHLQQLKRELRDYLELSIPDRKSMDSRVGHLNDF
uniref:Mediator of RNA polymerase II transcription subunit 18 n=2 Tax=Eremothecium gossypii (strain ATCC 10895 / CBS 109.51 / FGSC 9923 / NRRL Y-1056) TaxID=284811 RepID=MED18_EREGS|nr:RecName: Full=Mediator of RNA polymerase II transcription subunit 18; AltName: Full=Mediator complex subunit 18 [Eremothecium gossypii ATCC 10895]